MVRMRITNVPDKRDDSSALLMYMNPFDLRNMLPKLKKECEIACRRTKLEDGGP